MQSADGTCGVVGSRVGVGCATNGGTRTVGAGEEDAAALWYWRSPLEQPEIPAIANSKICTTLLFRIGIHNTPRTVQKLAVEHNGLTLKKTNNFAAQVLSIWQRWDLFDSLW